MKTAIAATGNQITSQVDERFGRASFFIITNDQADGILEVIENVKKNEQTGAGTGAAALIADKGVSVLVAGNLGPKAEAVINEAGIRFISFAGSVSEAMDVVRQQGTNTDVSASAGSGTSQKPSVDTSVTNTASGKGMGGGRGMGQGGGRGMGQGCGSGMGKGGGMGKGRCQSPGGGGKGRGMGR